MHRQRTTIYILLALNFCLLVVSLLTFYEWLSLFGLLITFPVLVIVLYEEFYNPSSNKRWKELRFLFTIGLALFVFWIILLVQLQCRACTGTGKPDISAYFEKIRDNEAELTAFFSAMPKGGDLHNHYSGSVYAETYWDYICSKDFYINTTTYEVADPKTPHNVPWQKWSSFTKAARENIKQKMIQQWSTKDYYPSLMASDKHFFDAFGKFGPAVDSTAEKGLIELKTRAIAENVQYIELMLSSIPSPNLGDLVAYNDSLVFTENGRNVSQLKRFLDTLFETFKRKNIYTASQNFTHRIEQTHAKLHIDDSVFLMRYLTYANRNSAPVEFFKNLCLAFDAAKHCPLIVGVNILSREDGEVSMRDYWLQMQMFRYCHQKFAGIPFSMHAGELTLGIVKPEELTWHISEAVNIAGANRIGHGVDISYEKNSRQLLNKMRKDSVAVEINLVSNEFILKASGERHPLMLYFDSKVPIVISTDDAGILRTNLVEQFVLLAKRYKKITYSDIKDFIRNSIRFSFIKDPKLKEQQLQLLDKRLADFENTTPLSPN